MLSQKLGREEIEVGDERLNKALQVSDNGRRGIEIA